MPRLLGSKLTTRKDLQRNMKRMGCVPSMGRPVLLKPRNRCCCPPADWCKIEGSNESKLVPAGTCDPPVLTFVSLVDDTTANENAGFAIASSVVTLTFKSSNVINTPTVVFTIGGKAVAGTKPAVANTTGNTWTATYTVVNGDAGKVSFTVDAKDKKGNEAETLTGTSDFVVDTGVPTVSFEYSLVSAPSTYLSSTGVTPATRTDTTKRVKKDDLIFITATADSVLLNLHASDKLKFTLPANLGGGEAEFFPLPGTTKVYRSAAVTVPGTLGTNVGYSGDLTVSAAHNASDEAGNALVNTSLSGQVYVDNIGVSLSSGTSFTTTGTATALVAGNIITVTVTSLENFTITTAAADLVKFNGQASTNAATPVGAGFTVAAKSHTFTLAVAGADAAGGSKGAVTLVIQTRSAFNTATVNNTHVEVATAAGAAWNLST